MACLIHSFPRCFWNERNDPGSQVPEMQKRHFSQRKRLGMTFTLNSPCLGNFSLVPTPTVRRTHPELPSCERFNQWPNPSSHLFLRAFGEMTVFYAWFDQWIHSQSPFDWHLYSSTETIKLKQQINCRVSLNQIHVSPGCNHTCQQVSILAASQSARHIAVSGNCPGVQGGLPSMAWAGFHLS